jgi:hypothetical protein
MKYQPALMFVWLLLHLLPFTSVAQTESDTLFYRVETTDGNEFIGKIIERSNTHIVLETETMGVINLPLNTIRRIVPVQPGRYVNGRLWLENPQASRYFVAPNGYGLRRGEGYYQNVWIFFNQFSVGITDHFSMGGGLIPLFFFGGAPTPVWVTPKFSVPVVKDRLNIGAGALAGAVLGDGGTGFGIVYGIATVGSRDRNLGLGLGYGFGGGSWSTAPLVNFSGMIRTGPRGYLMAESFFIPASGENSAVILLGGRTLIRRVGLDYGALLPLFGSETFVIIPWLGLTVPF